jgi:hypothetical protein
VTGQPLEQGWDEVEYSPEDRAFQLNDLIVKFRDLCEAKIDEVMGVAEISRQTISEAKDERDMGPISDGTAHRATPHLMVFHFSFAEQVVSS